MEEKKAFYIYLGVALSLFVIFISVILASFRTSITGRAQTPASSRELSLENSYLFASPIRALADGVSPVRVTVFLLNSQGLGIEGQKVTLRYDGNLVVTEIQAVTDSFGRAMFDVSTSQPQTYSLRAEYSGGVLPQVVSVVFQ